MSRLVATATTLLLAVASSMSAEVSVVNVSSLVDISLQMTSGQTNFDYYTEEAAEVAAKFTSYVTEYDSAVQERIDYLTSALTNYCQLVDQCAASIPAVSTSDKLNETVTENLAQVQEVDNTLRVNAYVCTSLSVQEPEGCVKTRTEALETLATISSVQNFYKVKEVMEDAYVWARYYLEKCIRDNINH